MTSITNISKPTTAIVNSNYPDRGLTWATITTTWASETDDWLTVSQMLTNIPKAFNTIWNTWLTIWNNEIRNWNELKGDTGITNTTNRP